MKIKDIVTPDPQCINPNASVAEAAQQMRLLDVGILPVCENNRLVGTVTDRDITIRTVAAGLDPKTATVRDTMTEGVFFCFEDGTVEEAAQLMGEKRIRRLPVLDRQEHVVGIVSIADLAVRAPNGALAGEVLECVSSPQRAV